MANIIPGRFTNRVAIVTGGASGIGTAIAERLAAEGARLALFDRDTAALASVAERLGASAHTVDIGQDADVQTAIARVAEQHGRLDILVNSAGIIGPTNVNIVDYASDAFADVLRVNLIGSFLVTKYAIPPMLANGYGRILLIASVAGKEGNPGMVGYSTSKAGVLGLVKAIGKEYATSGITVNGLAPAVIRTPMVARAAPEQVRYMTERIPMGRTGTLEEVAALACWIVSEEASFNTGAIFDLTGGRATY